MSGGVSMSVRFKGGKSIYDEARQFVPLRFGDVAITSAGKLYAEKIFHGAVIDFDKSQGPTTDVIKQVVHTCIMKADEYKFKSIAFPLLGTGAGGFPANSALEVTLIQLIKDLSLEIKNIRKVIIAIYGKKIIKLDEVIDKQAQDDLVILQRLIEALK